MTVIGQDQRSRGLRTVGLGCDECRHIQTRCPLDNVVVRGDPPDGRSDRRQRGCEESDSGQRLSERETLPREALSQTVECNSARGNHCQAHHQRHRSRPRLRADFCPGGKNGDRGLDYAYRQREYHHDPPRTHVARRVASEQREERRENESSGHQQRVHPRSAGMQQQHIDRPQVGVDDPRDVQSWLDEEKCRIGDQMHRPGHQDEQRHNYRDGEPCDDRPRIGSPTTDGHNRGDHCAAESHHPDCRGGGKDHGHQQSRPRRSTNGACATRQTKTRANRERQSDSGDQRPYAPLRERAGHRRQQRVRDGHPRPDHLARQHSPRRDVGTPAGNGRSKKYEHVHRPVGITEQHSGHDPNHNEERCRGCVRPGADVMPGARVGRPDIAGSFGDGKKCTALKHAFAPPQPTGRDGGHDQQSHGRDNAGSQENTAKNSRGVVRQVRGLVVNRSGFQGTDTRRAGRRTRGQCPPNSLAEVTQLVNRGRPQ